jgi:hypothetical protein
MAEYTVRKAAAAQLLLLARARRDYTQTGSPTRCSSPPVTSLCATQFQPKKKKRRRKKKEGRKRGREEKEEKEEGSSRI